MTLQEKRDKRAGLVGQMRALNNSITGDKKKLTAEEETKYVAMEADVDDLGGQINREDKLLMTEIELRKQKSNVYRPGGVADAEDDGAPAPKRNTKEYRMALFKNYARFGKNGILPEHVNALSIGSDVDGGYLVPEEFETKMTENLINSDPIRANATVITTSSDRNIPIETDPGTFGWMAEGGTYNDDGKPKIGRVILSAFKAGGILKASEELLQDEFFGVEAYLLRLASRRFSTLEQIAFAVGTGQGQPLGAFGSGLAASPLAPIGGVQPANFTGAISASVAIQADDLMDTFHTLPRAFRDNAAWITSDTMVKMIRKLRTGVTNDKTYLWQPGLSVGQPDRILGKPVYVSDGAPVPLVGGASTNGNVSIVFADWSYYQIADRRGVAMQVLKELFAGTGQVGFRFNKRVDGRWTFAPAIATFTQGPAS